MTLSGSTYSLTVSTPWMGLQEQPEQQRADMEQLKDERFVHLQALVDMVKDRYGEPERGGE
jgi:hypothetical protein